MSKVFCIGGWDPTGGAGLIADDRSMQSWGVDAYLFPSSNTIQNARDFSELSWLDAHFLLRQLQYAFSEENPDCIKIGLINPNQLELILEANFDVPIIWDPVAAASAGFDFLDEKWLQSLGSDFFRNFFLITPNRKEMSALAGSEDYQERLNEISHSCRVLLKGGHSKENVGRDELYYMGEKLGFEPASGTYQEKHGSGCVLASSISAALAKGMELESAISSSKRYVEYFLSHGTGNIGEHPGREQWEKVMDELELTTRV
jgi:hydroxymethylpyrimidine/phosphomethylpyrimidine kinase